DRRVDRVRGPEILEPAPDPRVEVQHAPLDELHHPDGREELRDRADAVHRLRGRGDAVRRARVAEPARPHDLLVVHERDPDGGQPLVPHLVVDEAPERGGDSGVVRAPAAPLLRGGPLRRRKDAAAENAQPRDHAAHYQLPRSPMLAMTRARRSAALLQFVSIASCAARPSPASIASMITSCSATEVWISSMSALM